MALYTIGYEGTDIDEFVGTLVEAGIRRVADVRKNPVSRKRGFSKSRLAEKLAEKGIEYFHFKGLGVPTEWRKQAKNGEITREKMFRDYERKVLPAQSDDIDQLRALMKKSRLAILCYEAEAADCHRRRVIDEIKKREKSLKITDLRVRPEKERLLPDSMLDL